MNIDEYEKMYRLEDTYWWYRALHELVESYVRRQSRLENSPLEILDAGCGTGRLLGILGRYGNSRGIDFSEKAVDFCMRRGLQDIETADLCSYAFPEGVYDVITCIDVLYHSAIIDESRLLENFYRSLKPGGILILNLPAFECLSRRHDMAVHGRRRYKKSDFIPRVRQIGFGVETQTYRLPHLFLPLLVKKYSDRISGRNGMESDLKSLPSSINWLMLQLNRLENRILKVANLPFGTSLFVVARK